MKEVELLLIEEGPAIVRCFSRIPCGRGELQTCRPTTGGLVAALAQAAWDRCHHSWRRRGSPFMIFLDVTGLASLEIVTGLASLEIVEHVEMDRHGWILNSGN